MTNKEKNHSRFKEYYQEHKEKEKIRHQKYYKENKEKESARIRKYNQEHKEKSSVRQKRYYEIHKEERNAKARKYRQEHPGITRRWTLKYRYNLSLEQVDELLIKQDHKCLICENHLKEAQRCVDHDHKTGKVRGILCQSCNRILGACGDDPNLLNNAIAYLKNHSDMEGGE